jgi:hypothetical protein
VASSVDHPNIVSIYDYGQTDKGEPYLVMEYVEGTLLYQLVIGSPSKCLHPLQAVDISLQVARALEHAHNRGVVHRDLLQHANCRQSLGFLVARNRLGTGVSGQREYFSAGNDRVSGQREHFSAGNDRVSGQREHFSAGNDRVSG